MQILIDWCRVNVLQAILLGVGMVLMMVGAVQWLAEASRGEEVVIVSTGDMGELVMETKDLVVDVSGAVVKPGVYSLPVGSRVGEAIELAGGFDPKADATWVAQRLNLAELVLDGQKIYVPITSEVGGEGDTSLLKGSVQGIQGIRVNSASQKELESLWGIGEARAQAIIQHRPYTSIDDLKTKAKIPTNVLEKINDSITFY
jgi:competence protein ComEA